MPTYIYKCNKCESTFKAFHEMSVVLNECLDCHTEGCIKKVPSLLTSLPEKPKEQSAAGIRVKEAIEDNRQLLLDQKRELNDRKI